MKYIYLIVGTLSLLTALSMHTASIVYPRGARSASYMADKPQVWSVDIVESHLSEDEIKEDIAFYIKQSKGQNYREILSLGNWCFVLTDFCFVGYLRERYFVKQLRKRSTIHIKSQGDSS